MSAPLALLVLVLGVTASGEDGARAYPTVGVGFRFDDGPALQEMLRALPRLDEVPAEVAAEAAAGLGGKLGFLRFVPTPPVAPGQWGSYPHDYHLEITLFVVDGVRETARASRPDVPATIGFGENGFLLQLRDRDGRPLVPPAAEAGAAPAVWYVPFVKSEAIQRAVRDGVLGSTIAASLRKPLREQGEAIVRELFSRVPLPAGQRVFTSTEWRAGSPGVYSTLVLLPFAFDQLGALPGSEFTLLFREPDRGRLLWRAAVSAPSDDLPTLFGDEREAVAHFEAQGVPADHPYWDLFADPVILVADEQAVSVEEAAAGPPSRLHDVLQRKQVLAAESDRYGPLAVHGVYVTRYLASEAAIERRSPVDVLPRNPFDDPER